MSLELRRRLFAELDQLVLVDPHTHINPLDPASHTLADILGYHYYTELAHSAGMPKEQIEEPGLDPKEKVRRLILIGEDADTIEKELGHLTAYERASDIRDAVERAFRATQPGDAVLLAPACASFDMFDSFEHRGKVFKEEVARLGI